MSDSDTAHEEQWTPQGHYDGPVDEDFLNHYYCCDKNLSLCGSDLYDVPVSKNPEPADVCVVCLDIWEMDNPCGARFCTYRKAVRRFFHR